MKRVGLVACGLTFAIAACGKGDKGGSTIEPPMHAASVEPGVDSASIVRAIAAHRQLDFRSYARDAKLSVTSLGFRRAAEVGASRSLEAWLPARGRAPLRLAIVDEPELSAEITALDLADVAGEPVGSSVVLRDAAIATDVVHLVDASRAEEIRWLRDLRAPSVARWSLRVGAAVRSVRLRERRIELLDRAGVVRLSTAPMFAIDARDQRREVDVSLRETSGALHEIVATLDPTGLAFPIAIDPAWSTVPSMAKPRSEFTLTAFDTGEVLAAGGTDGTNDLMTSEIYDPGKNTWSTAWVLTTARRQHTATLLPDGRVVLLGGSTTTASAEIFDPAMGWWTATGALSSMHSGHTATLISGKILVAAGSGNSTAELYDPATGATTAAGTLAERSGAADLLLPNGKVLVVGGIGSSIRGADLYDPVTRTWASAGAMISPRYDHTAILLPSGAGSMSGKVVVNGGRGVAELVTIGPELYDPTTALWSTISPASATRREATATLLPTGKILYAGGNTTSGAPISELFDPSGTTWSDAGSMIAPRKGHRAARLPGGRVLIAGGRSGSTVLSTVEIFATLPLGAACSLAGECASGNCVDGVCCNTACGGQCAACDVATSKGTCTPIAGAPKGGRTACSTGAGDPCKAQLCDGSDPLACHYAPAGAATCSAAACTDGVETHASTCNGAGGCRDVSTSCGAFACGATACNKTCAATADCAAGAHCSAGTCIALPGLGETCADVSSCTTGLFCVDGVCCGVAACSAGSSCAAGPTKGVCAKVAGTSCTRATECGTGFCADGVCCDGACDGQCEACDVPNASGKKGACLPVKGAPHGDRPACSAEVSNVCGAMTCDGGSRTSCAGRVAAEVTCREQKCVEGTLTLSASCDGKGACPAVVTSPCSGFSCDDAGRSCRTTCTVATDCAAGFDCIDHVCKRRTASCSPDGAQKIDAVTGAATPCAPFVCVAGACLSECVTSGDCASGALCQSKTCVAPAAADEGGGCGTSGRSSGGSLGAVVGLLAVGLVARGLRRGSRRARARALRTRSSHPRT